MKAHTDSYAGLPIGVQKFAEAYSNWNRQRSCFYSRATRSGSRRMTRIRGDPLIARSACICIVSRLGSELKVRFRSHLVAELPWTIGLYHSETTFPILKLVERAFRQRLSLRRAAERTTRRAPGPAAWREHRRGAAHPRGGTSVTRRITGIAPGNVAQRHARNVRMNARCHTFLVRTDVHASTRYAPHRIMRTLPERSSIRARASTCSLAERNRRSI